MVDRLAEGGQRPLPVNILDGHRECAERRRAGDRDPDRHVVVDREHESAQALVDRRRADADVSDGADREARIVGSHESLQTSGTSATGHSANVMWAPHFCK
jgi:hypothetical protein